MLGARKHRLRASGDLVVTVSAYSEIRSLTVTARLGELVS